MLVSSKEGWLTVPDLATETLRAWHECEGPHHNNDDPFYTEFVNKTPGEPQMDTPRFTYQTEQLNLAVTKYWDPEKKLISKIKRGSGLELDYVDHATVTRMLIDIDPYWEWEPMGLTEHGTPYLECDESGNPRAMWVLMTVCGRTIPAVGTIERPGAKGYGDTLKELIGDAIRNGALRFGICGGLWARGKWDEPMSAPAPKSIVNPLLDELGALTADQKKQIKESLGITGQTTIAKIADTLTKSGYNMENQTLTAWLEEQTS